MASKNKARLNFPRDFSPRDNHSPCTETALPRTTAPGPPPTSDARSPGGREGRAWPARTASLPCAGCCVETCVSVVLSTRGWGGRASPFLFHSWGNRGSTRKVELEEPGGVNGALFLLGLLVSCVVISSEGERKSLGRGSIPQSDGPGFSHLPFSIHVTPGSSLTSLSLHIPIY